MSNHKQNEYLTVEKDGNYRKFTLQQLEAMGADPDGNSYDGWKITETPKVPDEIAKPKAKKATTKTKDSDATIGETESTGRSDNSSTERSGGESSASGSEGDSQES